MNIPINQLSNIRTKKSRNLVVETAKKLDSTYEFISIEGGKIYFKHSCGFRTVREFKVFYRSPYCGSPTCVRSRLQETNLKKYGVKETLSSKEVRNKAIKTLEKRYDCAHPMHSDVIKHKVKSTNLRRYGVENPASCKEVQDKKKQTNLDKYGTEYSASAFIVREKIKQTKNSKKNKSIKLLLKQYNYELLEDWIGLQNLEYVENGIGRAHRQYKIKHLSCGNVFEDDLLEIPRCPECFSLYGGAHSKLEEYYRLFIEFLGVNVECNRRDLIKSLETNHFYDIDLYLPDHQIAFEVNGLYYHSIHNLSRRNLINSSYHTRKTEAALFKGIKLYHIWEHHNPEIIKSQIRLLLKDKAIKRHYARKLRVDIVDSNLERIFLEENHLHGYTLSFYSLGLFDRENLLQLISIRRCSEGLELARVCSKLNTLVVGGFSRLLKCLLNYIKYNLSEKVLITRADRDWSPSSETVYSKYFTLVEDSGPSLFYTNFSKVFSRQSLQKKKLNSLFPNSYNEVLSANNILAMEGIYPCYTSGNWKYKLLVD